MTKKIIAEGRTSTEAIEKGLTELGVSKDRVEIKILENNDKRSFFSNCYKELLWHWLKANCKWISLSQEIGYISLFER